MDSNGRSKFWDVLKNLHDNNELSIKKLVDASLLPKTLCSITMILLIPTFILM